MLKVPGVADTDEEEEVDVAFALTGVDEVGTGGDEISELSPYGMLELE